jgi:hypothetical protein
MGRAMDPYLLLGVSPGCTLEELKHAYRAKVWHAHPDLGGKEEAFIEVCGAYKQVLQELGRRHGAGGASAAQTHGRGSSPNPSGRTGRSSQRTSRRLSSGSRIANPSDPFWSPELILHDHPVWIGHPGKPPDPDWEPELILLDDQLAQTELTRSHEGTMTVSIFSSSWMRAIPARAAQHLSELSSQEKALGIVILSSMFVIATVALFQLWSHGFMDPAP